MNLYSPRQLSQAPNPTVKSLKCGDYCGIFGKVCIVWWHAAYAPATKGWLLTYWKILNEPGWDGAYGRVVITQQMFRFTRFRFNPFHPAISSHLISSDIINSHSRTFAPMLMQSSAYPAEGDLARRHTHSLHTLYTHRGISEIRDGNPLFEIKPSSHHLDVLGKRARVDNLMVSAV